MRQSPLYGRHRKRSIPTNSNTNSDAAVASPKQQASPSRHQEVSKPSALGPAAARATSLSVQPPRTPQGASHGLLEADGGLSAAQRVRMELSGSRAGSGSRSNSSEDVFSHTASLPVYDEKKNGPRSCPSTFNDGTKVSPGRRRQLRSGELVVSKLLPTRDSVNSLLTYLHELQISEASLRKELVTTKRHTEDELYQSITKLNELQRTIQEVERDRQLAQQRLEEKEQRIRELSAKLEQAETGKGRRSPVRSSISINDELSPMPRGAASSTETRTRAVTTANSRQKPFQEGKTPAFQAQEPLPLTMGALLPSTPPRQPSRPSLQPLQLQTVKQQSSDFESMSPRSPNRPLWDPWASGGATPMKNLPPVFTIGGTGLDPMVTSSTLADQESATTATEDYELKSVLMSPRHAQAQDEGYGNGHEKRQEEQQESPLLELQYAAPTSTVGSMPPSQPQDFYPTETEDASYVTRSLEETSLVEEFPSHLDAMLHIGAMPPIEESPYEDRSPTPTGSAKRMEWPDVQSQQETQSPLPSAATLASHEAYSPTLDAESFPEALLPPAPVEESYQAPAAHTHDPVQDTRDKLVAIAEPEVSCGDTSVLHHSPPEASPLELPAAPDVSKPLPASPSRKEAKAALTEPVALETLLVDFFTEVDKKRLKMAKVYGKRYAGREKWLFAELTKRYGAAKVSSLKGRLETGSGAASTSTGSSDSTKDQANTSSTAASDHPKPARHGHPRHAQFFHPPAPAGNVDLSTDMRAGPPQVPPRLVLPQENDCANSQGQDVTEGSVTRPRSIFPLSPRGKVSPGRAARVSPRQRRSGGTIPPFGGPSPPFAVPQGTDESNNGGMNGPPVMNGLPPLTQQNQPSSGQFNQPPPPQRNGMEASNPAPMGLRQRHNTSAQGQKTSVAELPTVTLEGLLKELYKKHQPDKLKNVAIVAKQYAGKERELVGLLKGKYGALSVKRLEENLEVLERAHRARTDNQGSGKKRGCFVRTISLMFWLSVLLYFSLGAVFVSFVVLDVWECRALDVEEQELESEECVPLKKELDVFTYERVGDYVSQSHPEACFCSEWKARESALLSNLSGEDLVNLARLVPFSPDSFGEPWIATVKEQIPSQEFYESYAKPVVDLSLDLGSFVWSSVLEIAGYDEVSEKKERVKEDVVENDTTDLPSPDDIDVHMDSLEHEAVEKEILANDEGVNDQLTNDAEVEFDSVEVPGVAESEEDIAEGGANTSDEDLEADVMVDEKDPLLAEDETGPVDQESHPLPSEANVDENVSTGESLGELESEESQLIEETEATEDGQSVGKIESVSAKKEPIAVPESEVEEVSATDYIIIMADEVESAAGDDDEISVSTETEVAGVVAEDTSPVADEDATEAAAADTEETSGEDVAVASGDIVEMEIRQEGLDLSYPEAENDVDAMDDTSSADTTDAASSHGDDDPGLVRTDDAEVLSVSSEEEAEVAEFEDASAVVLEEESESVEKASEDLNASASIEEWDVGAPSGRSQVETDKAEADSSDFQALDVETSVDEVRPAATADGSESWAPIDVDVPVLASEEADDSLSEESELDGREDDAAILMESEPNASSPSNEEGVSTSHDNLFNVEEEEISIAAEAETELSSGSSDDTAVGLLAEENVVASLGAGDDEGGNSDSAPVEEQEPVLEDDDASLEEIVSVVFSIDDVDESAIPAVDDAMAPELKLKEDVADVPSDEEVEHELADASFSGFLQLKEDAKDDIVATALKTDTAGEQSGAKSEDKFASPIETAEESVWEEERFTVDGVEMGVTSTIDMEVVSPDFAERGSGQIEEVKESNTPDADGERGLKSNMNVKADDEDSEEQEEIAFMEELEDPDEVLRMAEQAAAAELSAMETR